jgi:hypothetical protein
VAAARFWRSYRTPNGPEISSARGSLAGRGLGLRAEAGRMVAAGFRLRLRPRGSPSPRTYGIPFPTALQLPD